MTVKDRTVKVEAVEKPFTTQSTERSSGFEMQNETIVICLVDKKNHARRIRERISLPF